MPQRRPQVTRTSARRAYTATQRLIRGSPFESAVIALALVYVALRLSPSSYALALELLGEPTTPLAGEPRGIRTDEWSVMTPLFQAAVNNDFREVNETSFYDETLRSFVGLPLLNWGLPFKPQVWAFFVLPPALAYSIYWASIPVLMLLGWSLLLRALGFSRAVAAMVALLLFFSPFVQAWSWMPQLALYPWVLLALLRIRSNLVLGLTLALLVSTWLIGFFYLPGLPPLFFLAIAILLAFRPQAFERRKLASAVAGIGAGIAIAFAYFGPVLGAYADSEYPGGRWVKGGALSLWQVASQFLPGTTTEGYSFLIANNLSEAATVASWLPALAVSLIDHRDVLRRRGTDSVLRRDVGCVATLLLMWFVITAWQLVPLVPLSYLVGFGLSPESRTLFASGALLVIASAYALDRLPLRVTPIRLGLFGLVVAGSWALATLDLQETRDLVLRDELFVLLPVAVLAVFAARRTWTSSWHWQGPVLLTALVPTVVQWSLYNPLQSTRVIFRKPDTVLTRRLDDLAETRPDGSIAVPGVRGAILNGVGYRSVAHVMVVPSPELFRPYFRSLDERTFDRIFNRYAHIRLTTRPRPYVLRPDKVYVPLSVMSRYAATDRRMGAPAR
jgi:hypothetical protein